MNVFKMCYLIESNEYFIIIGVVGVQGGEDE